MRRLRWAIQRWDNIPPEMAAAREHLQHGDYGPEIRAIEVLEAEVDKLLLRLRKIAHDLEVEQV